MKKTAAVVLAAGLAFPVVSSLSAGELTDEQREELTVECREVGEQHGISGDRMEEWIDRCLRNIERVHRERQGQHGGEGDGQGHPGGMGDHGHGMEGHGMEGHGMEGHGMEGHGQ